MTENYPTSDGLPYFTFFILNYKGWDIHLDKQGRYWARDSYTRSIIGPMRYRKDLVTLIDMKSRESAG